MRLAPPVSGPSKAVADPLPRKRWNHSEMPREVVGSHLKKRELDASKQEKMILVACFYPTFWLPNPKKIPRVGEKRGYHKIPSKNRSNFSNVI